MNIQTSLKALIVITLFSQSISLQAQNTVSQMEIAPVTDLHFQNDYICNAKVGDLITSGTLNFDSSQAHRFGFTYPVKVHKM